MSILKKTLFSIALVLLGCDFFDCKDLGDSGNFSSDVSTGTYYTTNFIYPENYSKHSDIIHVTEILNLRKDSTFSIYDIDSLGDTLISQTGNYTIHKTPNNEWTQGEKVYSFIMNVTDYTGMTSKPKVNEDSILLDVQTEKECFTLAAEDYDGDFCKKTHFYTKQRVFCKKNR